VARRRTALALIVGATLAPVLVVTAAPHAQAAEWLGWSKPRPVAVPSDVIGSFDEATPEQRARMVGNTQPSGTVDGRAHTFRVPASAPRTSLQKAGSAFVRVAKFGTAGTLGLPVGFALGAEGMELLGYDSYGATEQLACDLLSGDGVCVLAAPDYAANADVIVTSSTGWVPYSTIQARGWDTNGVQGTLTHAYAVLPEAEPEFEAGPGVNVGWSMTISAASAPRLRTGAAFQAVCRRTGADTATVRTGELGPCLDFISGYTNWPSSTAPYTWVPNPVTSTKPVPTGWVFDHIVGCPAPTNGNTSCSLLPEETTRWYPKGHASRPPETTPDPERSWLTSWRCSGSPDVRTAESVRFTEAQETPWPSWPEASCPGGVVDEVWVEQLRHDGEPGAEVARWPAAGTGEEVVRDWATTSPQCLDGSCLLTLHRVDPNGTELDCFAHPQACVDWYTTAEPTRSERYRCRYAGVAVDVERCRVYAPSFNVLAGSDVLVRPNSDPTQAPVRVPSTGVEPYADPATGEPVPRDQPAPGPAPGEFREDALEGCPPPFETSIGGIGHWIWKGVTCALVWAFVPGQMPLNEQLADVAEQAAPWSWVTQLVQLGGPGGTNPFLGIPDACPDWEVRVVGTELPAVCGSSFTEAIVAGRPMLAVFMAATAFSPLLRSLWYAVLPGLQVVPTK